MERSDTTSLLLLGGAAAIAYSLSRGQAPAMGQRDPMPSLSRWKKEDRGQGPVYRWVSAEGPHFTIVRKREGRRKGKWVVVSRPPKGWGHSYGREVATADTAAEAVKAARDWYYANIPGPGHRAGQRAGFGGGEHISWEQQMYEKRMATPAKKYIYRFKPGRHPGIEQDIGKAVSYARSKGLLVEENVEESLRGGPWTRAGVFPVADFRAQGRSARGQRTRMSWWEKDERKTHWAQRGDRILTTRSVTVREYPDTYREDVKLKKGTKITVIDTRFDGDLVGALAGSGRVLISSYALGGNFKLEATPEEYAEGKWIKGKWHPYKKKGRSARGRRAPLLKRQEAILKKATGDTFYQGWADLSPSVKSQLRRVKDQEDLPYAVDRWFDDHFPPRDPFSRWGW
jgi:hypothetical protein